MTDLENKLRPLCDYLESEIKAELTRQGHVATGKLRDSIKVVLAQKGSNVTIEGHGANVAKYVDWGRRPGGKRVPIDALLAWLRLKGLSVAGKSQVQLAWAIQTSIWKNGIPTDHNQDKVGFVTRTLTGNRDRIKSDIEAACRDFYKFELNNIIREVKEVINVN